MNTIFEPLPLRVTTVSWETDSIRTLELCPLTEGPLPEFTAGAHVTIHLPGGIQRSYSLMNPPEERHRYLLGIALDRASRGGSRYIHEQVTAGTVLQVEPPRNLFGLREDAPFTVLIGGGIGITPLLSMASRLRSIGAPWSLHYATRSRNDAAFLRVVESLGDRAIWHGDKENGQVLDLSALVQQAPAGAHFYCCGPGAMLDAFEAATRGLPADHVHQERFAPAAQPAHQGGYKVELARSGKTLHVAPNQSILQALQTCGIPAPSSCLQGICGVCETRVLAGTPDHRDAVLSPAERTSNTTMMICCSGSLGDTLVLDL